MKERLLNLLTHSAFISAVISLIIIILLPDIYDKYTVKKTGEIFCSSSIIYFADLDSDGESEEIVFDLAESSLTKVILKKGEKIINQYNIKNLPAAGDFYFSGDYNSDGFQECYIFTSNGDSIFLSIIDPLSAKDYLVYNRFIDIQGKAPDSDNKPNVIPLALFREDNSLTSDLYFYIVSGFSLKPRRVYRYINGKDSLLKSPESGACIEDCFFYDINNDKFPEIMLNVRAAGNTRSDYPFSDQYGWLMVLDLNMNFLFPPVRFLQYPSNISVFPLKTNNAILIGVLHDYSGTDTISSAFYLFDTGGNQIAEKRIDGFQNSHATVFPNEEEDFSSFYFLKKFNGEIEKIGSGFSVLKKIRIEPVCEMQPLATIDADGDGKNEYIFCGADFRSLVIARNDFSGSLSTGINYKDGIKATSLVLKQGEKPQVYFQSGDIGTFLRYSRNPLYYLHYPLYAAIYGVIFLVVFLIFRIQRYRLMKREELERQMVMLQMKAIKNQIDPHFTLNVLNSIGSLYAMEKDRQKADYVFGKYARLIRETVISSDKISVPLGEEIDFVRNYLDLERFRCEDAFSYSIDIDLAVDMQRTTPRMLVHTFVENAVKHGLKSSRGKGKLGISIRKEENNCIIEVEDNNPDHAGNSSTEGTGKGLKIVGDLVDLFFKLEKVQIKYELITRISDDNTVSGHVARVVVPG